MDASDIKVTYFVQRFRPEIEAASKEVYILSKNIPSRIHDLHLDSVLKLNFSPRLWSYHFLFYPLLYPGIYLFSREKINHLYTGVPDLAYLPTLPKKKMIITLVNGFSSDSIARKISYLKKAQKIIIQSEIQKQHLLRSGIKEEKLEVVRPPVDLANFSYKKPSAEFLILNASCPTKFNAVEKRGITLLTSVDKMLKDVKIKLLWRNGEFDIFQKNLGSRVFENIILENKLSQDMNGEYGKASATIIPYLRFDEFLKTVPNSVIESLAAGKPVLVSSQTGIADTIREEKCGVVFEPTKEGLLTAIAELKKNYRSYQKNCRKTAEKYFSLEQFIHKHEVIYNSLS